MAQFAQLGITTTDIPPAAAAATSTPAADVGQPVQGGQDQHVDEFDMFAQSRTAYGTHQG